MELYVNPTITGFRQEVDGTIKELKIGSNKEDAYANIIEQGASAKLDKNKTATINVSTYTEPVEITPTAGKDGMKKTTVTLSNIPSPSGVTTLYAWHTEIDLCYTTTETPTTSDKALYSEDNRTSIDWETITEVTEEGIKISVISGVFARYSAGDISLT